MNNSNKCPEWCDSRCWDSFVGTLAECGFNDVKEYERDLSDRVLALNDRALIQVQPPIGHEFIIEVERHRISKRAVGVVSYPLEFESPVVPESLCHVDVVKDICMQWLQQRHLQKQEERERHARSRE